jgi:hypothetical protein
MSGTSSPAPTPTRDPFGRRLLRAARHPLSSSRRRHVSAIAGGVAAALVLGGTLAVTTQPGVGEALGLPTAAPTATPALSGTALSRAQAEATISSAWDVVNTANSATSTVHLKNDIASLSDYRKLDGDALQKRIAATVETTDDVAQQSATASKQQADKLAAARVAAAAAAAQQAKAEAAARAQAAANTPAAAQATASSMAASRYGWGSDQFSCLNSLWTKESGWNYQAYNPSGAFGIPQALPGSKMATVGSDWQTNASTQIAWGLQYIQAAYGTPCAAWAHSEATNYY